MRKKRSIWIPAMLNVLALLMPAVAVADVPLMTKDELKAALGAGNITILDVRSGRDWSASEFKIQGAVRVDPGDVATWAANFAKDKATVLYCA
jgi:Rhodanese-like domain